MQVFFREDAAARETCVGVGVARAAGAGGEGAGAGEVGEGALEAGEDADEAGCGWVVGWL